MTDQAKLMGAQWKALSAAEKQKFNELAKKDKARYESEKAELYSDFRGSSASFGGGSKRKHSRWSDEEVAHLRSVGHPLASTHAHLPCCHLTPPSVLAGAGSRKVWRRQLD